jgi:hypothetical protein
MDGQPFIRQCVQLLGILALLFLARGAAPCFGLELSLSGQYTWEYDGYSQLGGKGFFGPFDVDQGDNPGGYGGNGGSAASMNAWIGHEIGEITSGSDAALQTMYMTLYPQIRINKAVRVRGAYRVGSWETPESDTSVGALVRSEYATGLSPGVQRSFSPGYWNMLWLTAQTPWGIIGVGKRSFPVGTGLMWDAEDNADAAGPALFASYGPLRAVLAVSPWLPGQWRYYTLSDRNAARSVDVAGGVLYNAGPVSAGLGARYWRTRIGPESATFQGIDDPVAPTGRYAVIPSDLAVTHGGAYVKYNNGRFFLNTELAWSYGITRNQRWLSTASGELPGGRSIFAPWYLEHVRGMVETGIVAGPAKVSLLWAWIPGPDRRHGVIIDRRPDSRFVSAYSNVSVFKPYSLLLSYTYGGGNNSITADSRHGYMTDANTFGIHFAYAVAANLNVFASLFHAERVSHGYGRGFIRPEYSDGQGRFTGRVQYNEQDNYRAPAPAIPDGNLGPEVNWGVNWRLLEGFVVKSQFGVWWPGKWFAFACVDRSNPGWKTPAASNNWGINPERGIAPVFGMEFKIETDF